MDETQFNYFEYDGDIPARRSKDNFGFPERFIGGEWVKFDDLGRWYTKASQISKEECEEMMNRS